MLSSGTKIDLHRAQRNLLRVVASFEFAKGLFVLLIGLTAVLLVHRDAWVIAEQLLALLHISTDRRLALDFLDFATGSPKPVCGRQRNSRSPIRCYVLPRPTACGSSAPGLSGLPLSPELYFFRWRSAGSCGALQRCVRRCL